MIRLRTAFGLAGATIALGGLASAQSFALNEIYASHAGTDDQEFVEIVGPAGASLDGMMILVVEGQGTGAGTLDDAIVLTGNVMPGDGYFVAGTTTTANVDLDFGSDNVIENGSETFYLIATGDTAAITALLGTSVVVTAGPGLGTTVLPGMGVVLDVVGMVDDDWPVEDTIYDTATVLGPDGSFFPGGIFRTGDAPAGWCHNNFLDFDDVANAAEVRTPGETNTTVCSDPPPAAEALHLNEIYISHAGTDDMEYVELIGTPGGGLDGFMVLVIEGQGGGAGALDRVWDLSGNVVPDDGFFVLGDTAVANSDFDLGSDNNIENGTETIYLIQTDDTAAIMALLGTSVQVDAGPGDGTTVIPTLSTVLDIVGVVDDDYPLEDTIYDGATVVGPDGSFFPGGIFRYNDYPFDWCTAFFLDFDDEANVAQPRNPGEANVGDCSLECFLVFGQGPGATAWGDGSHTFGTQLDGIIASYPVLLNDVPLLPLPQEPTGPLGSSTIMNFNRPQGPTVFHLQILMWIPEIMPGQPEQYTSGMQIIYLPGRGVYTRPFGQSTGMEVWAEVVTGPDGNEYLTFPFSIPGF